MPSFWDYRVFDNPLRAYIIVTATVLFVIALKRFISRLIGRFLFSFIRKMGSGLDRVDFLNLVVGPIGTFLVVLVSVSSVEKLHFPSALDFDIYEVKFRTIVDAVAVIVIIVSFIWLLMRLVDFIAVVLRNKARTGRVPRDNQMIVFIRDFLKAIIGIIGILMILDEAFKVNVSAILASLGLATAAFALAAKESIENLIASFVIFFDKPFTAGDYLKVNNVAGTVEKIGLRSTRIRTDQKTYVTVPNKQMVDSIVDNLSLRTQRKGELRLELSLSTSAEELDEFIPGIRTILVKDNVEESTVFLNDISGSAFLVNVDYFTAAITLDEFNEVRQRVNLDILRLMEKLKIGIAGAGTDIRLTNVTPVGGGEGRES
ncbi:MAG TPA: mechanosensitive ion channel domain-containing protein [Puia sp.]|jgi:MscS family membrane protein|nr:mechanosensitive ion channel domain-containing protein [Puia sp.]